MSDGSTNRCTTIPSALKVKAQGQMSSKSNHFCHSP